MPRSIRPVATVPRPVIENTSSTGIRNGLSISALRLRDVACPAPRSSSWITFPDPLSGSPLAAPSAPSRGSPACRRPGTCTALSSSRTSSSTRSSSSASSTMSHLFRNTTIVRHVHLPGQEDVLARLRHRAVGRRHHQDRAVHLRRTRDHVLHVVGVPRAVHVRVVPLRRLVLHVRRRDRDLRRSAPWLRRLGDLVVGRCTCAIPLLRLDLRERRRQRRLPVVHVADRAHVHVRLRPLEFCLCHVVFRCPVIPVGSRLSACQRLLPPYRYACRLRDDLFRLVLRNFLVVRRTPSSTPRAPGSCCAAWSSTRTSRPAARRPRPPARRRAGSCRRSCRARLDRSPITSPRKSDGSHHLDLHHRLEHAPGCACRAASLTAIEPAILNAISRAVHVVVAAEDERRPSRPPSGSRPARRSPAPRVMPGFDRLDVLAGDDAAHDLVLEDEALRPARPAPVLITTWPYWPLPPDWRMNLPSTSVDLLPDRLAVRHLRPADVRLDLELALHAVDDDLEVQLAHAGDDRLAGLGVGAHAEGRVLFLAASAARWRACPGRPSSSARWRRR